MGSSIQTRNRNGQEEELEADLEVGFGTLKEKYRSKVMMDLSDESALKIISYSTQTSLLDHLKTIWTFTPGCASFFIIHLILHPIYCSYFRAIYL